tara:strand:- start:166 stop:429 length:264 start_codon:yes stop_codon:yes gene_type:complete
MKENPIVKDLIDIQHKVEDLSKFAVKAIEKEMKQERPNMTSSTMLIDVQASATHLVLALKNLSSYYGNHIDETNNRVVPSNRKGMQQ